MPSSKKRTAGKTTRAVRIAEKTPQNSTQAQTMVSRMGEHLRRVRSVRTETKSKVEKLEEEIASLKAKAEAACDADIVIATQLAALLHAYAEANKDKLTKNNTVKTVTFTTGDSFRWFDTPPKVNILNEASFFAEVKQLKLDSLFIRTKEEPNRDALLANRDTADTLKSVDIDFRSLFEIKIKETGDKFQTAPDVQKPLWEFIPNKEKK